MKELTHLLLYQLKGACKKLIVSLNIATSGMNLKRN